MEFSGLFSIVSIGWLGILTGWILYREVQLRRFFDKSNHSDVRRLLEDLFKNLESTNRLVGEFKQTLEYVQKKDLRHIQKIGLVRFNPFRDAGGNQSFALSLLNEENSGIIITGLHARETTRVYIKDVHKGISKHELSQEEQNALNQAVEMKK